MRISIIQSAITVAAAVILTIGCMKSESTKVNPATNGSSAASADEDVAITEADVEMPSTFSDAVTQIAGYRDKIQAAVAAKTPSKAHRSLDELDIVLGKLMEIARDSSVPKNDWETVNTAARELRNRFNEVHSAIDEKREPDYNAVAKSIDGAIERLREVAGADHPDTLPSK
jgi:nicotinamide mononucleotide adenylyltransferase